MEIKVEDRVYNLSYSELKAQYKIFVSMSNDEFIKNIHHVTHLACIISWMKELSPDATIGDRGLIHELIHIICKVYPIKEDQECEKIVDNICNYDLNRIREKFKELLELV